MNNIIIKSQVNDFLQSQELQPGTDAENFEKYAAYSVFRKACGQEFDLDDVLVGGSDDTGIDALGILVNGVLVNSIDEIDDLLAHNNHLEVTYIFIQAKTTPKFEVASIGTFCRGVSDFFLQRIHLNRNEDITKKIELTSHLFKNIRYFRNNPKCTFYYICTGFWNDTFRDQKNIMEATKNELIEASIFSDVNYKICGANEISNLYREASQELSVEIDFSLKATLPKIPNIQSAYIGILPLAQFKKLVLDDDGNTRSVFEDNIRDFLPPTNPVNKKIEETLSSDASQLFPLLNNGVTIVADEIKQIGNTMHIQDYQIVNGCQTSNVIAKHYSQNILEGLYVPVKIIETKDESTKNAITLATNNQPPIKREQLAALTSFQRALEEYYNAYKDQNELYYERRLNQYSKTGISKAKIITVSNQIKAYASMFVRCPHRVTSYYGKLTKNIATESSEIFNPNHQLFTYYLAGLAWHRLDCLFRNNTIKPSYKTLRYFILMALCVSFVEDKLTKDDLTIQKLNEEKLEGLKKVLFNPSKTKQCILDIVKRFDESDITGYTKENLKTAQVTDKVLSIFQTS